jgi:polar amino acid transport system substrate-binding protein
MRRKFRERGLINPILLAYGSKFPEKAPSTKRLSVQKLRVMDFFLRWPRPILLLILCFSSINPAAADSIRLYYFDQPLSYATKDGQASGPLIDLLRKLAVQAGVTLEFSTGPWPRAQYMLEHGELDAVITIANESRRKFLLFAPTPLLVTPELIYHRRDDPRFDHLQQATDLSGLVQVSLFGQLTEPVFDRTHWNRVRSVDSIIAMILAHRADYCVSDASLMDPLLARQGSGETIVGSPAPFLTRLTFQFGLRKSFPQAAQIVAALDHAILAAQNSGELEQSLTLPH